MNTTQLASPGERKILSNGVTLIALGLSVLFLNSWHSLFVRTMVGLFWGTYFLILNGPDAVRALRKKNDKQCHGSFRSSTQH